MAVNVTTSGNTLTRTTGLPSISSFTMCGWFRYTTAKNYNTFFAIGAADAEPFYFCGAQSNNTAYMYTQSVNDLAGAVIPVGQWNYYVFVCDGTTTGNLRIYRNGRLDILGNGTASVSATKLYLCNDNSNYNHWLQGAAENVIIYNRPLTPVEIIKQTLSPDRPIDGARLNGWYPLKNNTKDYSGNGNHWTETGTMVYEAGPTVRLIKPRYHLGSVPIASGTLVKTNANDVLVSSGFSGVSPAGYVSYTNANDSLSATGSATGLVGSSAGVGSQTGNLLGSGALVGSSAGVASSTSLLVGSGALTGTSAGSADSANLLLGDGALVASASGAGSANGTFDLIGAAAGVASSTAGLTANGALVGSSSGAASSTALLAAAGALLGTSSGIAALVGTLSLIGTSAGVATPSGTIGADGALVGSASGTGSSTSDLKGSGALVGSSAGVATASLQRTQGDLAASSAGIGSSTAALAGSGGLQGTSAGIGTPTGLVAASGAIAGPSNGVSVDSGTIIASGSLAGVLSGAAALTAILLGNGAFIGTSLGTATVTGNIYDLANPSGAVVKVDFTSEPIWTITDNSHDYGKVTVA